MTDLALQTIEVGSAETVPGEVVRKLVAWSEREIDRLLQELDVALREAEAAERQVSKQPAAADLTMGTPTRPSPAEMLTQVLPATPAASAPADAWPVPTVRGPANGTVARTTVVRRDPPGPQATDPAATDPVGSEDAQSSPSRSEMVRRPGRKASLLGRLQDHWMMAVGIAVTLVGLALLLLG